MQSGSSLILQAGKAFGSGAHPSTQGVLQLLQGWEQQLSPARILDMGCGSGILSLAAALTWPAAQVVAVDIDKVAVETTARNAAENALADRVLAVRADAYNAAEIIQHAPYDLVLANILAETHITLARGVVPVLASGAMLVLSGILAWLVPQVVEAYRQQGFTLLQQVPQGDWHVLVLGLQPA